MLNRLQFETEKETELRKALERYVEKPSDSCRRHLENIIKRSKDPNLLKYLATIITRNEFLAVFEERIADNHYTPPHVLKELALSQNPLTRAYAAFNPNTPASSILILKNDPNEFISIIALKNPELPPDGFLARIFRGVSNFITYMRCLLGL